MIKGRNDYYKHGDQNAICDECGFKFKLSALIRRWDGALVDRACWEPRHPRDLPPPIRPERAVKESSPAPTDEFVSVTYATSPTVPTATFDEDNVD